jgi:hypothetical protein
MSNWWDADPIVGKPQSPVAPNAAPQADGNWWSNDALANPADRRAVESGTLLPFSRYNDGTWGFDSNAGIVGSIKDTLLGYKGIRDGSIDPLSDKGIATAWGIAGLANPVNPGVRSGDRAIPGVARAMEKRAPVPPTQQQLRSVANTQYKAARASDVDFPADAVANMAARTQRNLDADGIIGELAPKTHSILGKLQAVPSSGNPVVTISGLEAARRSLSKGPGRAFDNPTDREAARAAIQSIDDFFNMARRGEKVPGTTAAAIDTLQAARGNYAASQRSGTLEGITEAATRRAGASHSGQNLDNTLRGRVASARERPKVIGGFDDAERAALDAVAQGTPVRNATRFVGNTLAGGGGVGMTALGLGGGAAGAAAGGPVGAAVGAALPVVGFGARQLANTMTDRALMKVAEQTRMRSPLYQQMQRDTPMTVVSPEKRALIMRMLLQGAAPPAAPSGAASTGQQILDWGRRNNVTVY